MTPTRIQLITGLLGSGKTECLHTLIRQKPAQETWGLIINEFGALDIDAATIQQRDDLHIIEIRGGCFCCTGQFQLQQSLSQLLAETSIDRIFIEASGLGHPAAMLDLIGQMQQQYAITLQKTLCIITPKQLTQPRWQASQVMRDLVTLSDIMVLNQCDLSTQEEITAAKLLLAQHKPHFDLRDDKQFIEQVSSVTLAAIEGAPSLKFLPKTSAQRVILNSLYTPEIPHLLQGYLQYEHVDQQKNLIAIAWQFDAKAQFNRTELKKSLAPFGSVMARLKMIIRTGKEWQRVDWLDQQLHFQDIAWRKDSRIELILNHPISSSQLHALDEVWRACIR